MKTSEIVENLKTTFTEHPIVLYTEERERKLNDPDEAGFNKAFIKICELWNKDEKARGFVKHLIRNFYPVDPMTRRMGFTEEEIQNGKNRCCILNIKVAGITTIAEEATKYNMAKMQIDAQALTEKREKYTEKEMKKLKKLRMAMPVEVRNNTQAFMSDNSDKILSGEAVYALDMFVKECIIRDEKEVFFIVNKKAINFAQSGIKKEKRLNNKEVNKVAKANTYGLGNFLDPETLSKLEGVKSELRK